MTRMQIFQTISQNLLIIIITIIEKFVLARKSLYEYDHRHEKNNLERFTNLCSIAFYLIALQVKKAKF